MADLDDILENALDQGDVPFVVGMLARREEGVIWAGAAGDSNPGQAAGPDTLFTLFSMTKAVGAVAAMILVDRGRLTMETEVREVLPAFDDLKVLESMDGSRPV